MTSVVQICNMALSRLGQRRINAIDEDTNEARACNLHYVELRDREIEAFDWHHTITRKVLAAVPNDRTEEWDYAYQRPSLMASFIGVLDPDIGTLDPPFPYLIEGSTIYTNVEKAVGVYAGTSSDPGAWTALFRGALAWCLAREICMSLTEEPQRLELATQSAMQEMSKAQAHDLRIREHMQTYTRMSPALLARLGLSVDGWVRFEDAAT